MPSKKPLRKKTSKKKVSVSKQKSSASKPKPKTKPKPKAKPVAKTDIPKKKETRTKPSKPVAPVQPEAKPKPAHTVKPLPHSFLMELADVIQKAVYPLVAAARGREIVGAATSGDATFELDRVAERALLAFLRSVRMPVAYYSEDAGYATFTSSQPQHLLVVDPVDGTRAAKNGFEACVVSVAATRVIERPRMADVDSACVMEIVGGRAFYAERGKGVRIISDGHSKRPKLSKNADLESISWAMTVPARPAELIFPTAARLIDLSSLKGGFFSCNSTSYSLTRLVTHQLDACVDFANRYYREIHDIVEDQFINAGRGVVLGIAPYDLAASLLIAEEAGCVVTDAFGGRFDDVLLLDSSVANQRSLIAAANQELHAKLMNFFDTRIKQFEELLKRRAGVKA